MPIEPPEQRNGSAVGESDEEMMRLAIAEAERALAHGDVPVGAVAIVGGSVVASRHNEREHHGDPTAHAEMLLLRDVAQAIGDWRMGAVTVIVTLEPCAMCAGAMVNGRVGRLVFGAYDPKAGAVGSLYNLCADPRLNHEVPAIGGVLADECGALLTSFFEARRATDPGQRGST
jgi:tRNA(adenine34) deaminase